MTRRWAFVAALAALSAAGCGGADPSSPAPASATTAASAPSSPSSESEPEPEPSADQPDAPARLTAQDLNAGFVELAAKLKGPVAVAWAPVGSTGQVQSLGAVRDEDAWSTLKAAIAVAAVTHDGGAASAATRSLMTRAIRYSDNSAALSLFRSLGPRASAAAQVDDVLRQAGDTTTRARQVSFGRTVWRVQDQAQFAAGLPCLKDSAPVLSLMGQIVKEHRWGLGSLTQETAFKGGWGPSAHGYLMRQLGVVSLPGGGQVAVAVATQPSGGSHPSGAANLNSLASWLADQLSVADGGTCPPG